MKINEENITETSNETLLTENTEQKDSPSKKDKPKKKWKKTKHEKPSDPFEMKELHVKGNVKRRKKRQVRRSLNLSSIDQSHSFEKPSEPTLKTVEIPTSISPQEIAQKLAMKVSEIISVMIRQGIMATGNEHIDQDTAILVIEELGHKAVPMDERSVEDSVFDEQINENESLKIALTNHVKNQLTPFKYPRWYEFVNELPKTATGKIQRYKLRTNND